MLRSFFFFIVSIYLTIIGYTALAEEVIWPPKIEKIDLAQEPLGWLKSHEKVGGHTIDRHVSKSDFYLKKRVSTAHIFEASSFKNLTAAEQIIALGLWENTEELAQWMNNKNSADRLVIEIDNKVPIGK